MHRFNLNEMMPNEVWVSKMPDLGTGVVKTLLTDTIARMKDGDILFLDEIFNDTLRQTLSVCLSVLEDRILPNGQPLPDVLIVAASNEDGMTHLTPQIKERFVVYKIIFDIKVFRKHFYQYGFDDKVIDDIAKIVESEKWSNKSNDWNYNSERSIHKALNAIAFDIPTPYECDLLPILNQVAPLIIKSFEKSYPHFSNFKKPTQRQLDLLLSEKGQIEVDNLLSKVSEIEAEIELAKIEYNKMLDETNRQQKENTYLKILKQNIYEKNKK